MEQKTVCLASDISYLCGVYFAHWVYSYFLQKKRFKNCLTSTRFFQTRTFQYALKINHANDKKILRNSYVPIRPKFYNKHNKSNLDTQLQQETYNKIISNPDEYFEKTTITNFDLIHNHCRGDKLTHNRKYYENLFKKRSTLNLIINYIKTFFFLQLKDVNLKMFIFKKIYKKIILTELLSRNN